jgi:hypothetical protein
MPNNLEESGADFSLREVLQLRGDVEIAATPVVAIVSHRLFISAVKQGTT